MTALYEELTRYSGRDYYPMHMPGHKRNEQMLSMVNPYTIDITEVEGFDNLHQAEGILKHLMSRVSALYKSKKSYLLVNGSTSGILAGIAAVVNKGDKILISRNSHKSVYDAILLNQLRPIFIYPEQVEDAPIFGGISPDLIKEMLIKHPDITLVVITSPTYEGVVSDIETISRIVHEHGALLIIDEAHGAHFGFYKEFPISAVTLGADIVIQSLHKTLPSFTQTALLHSNRPDYSLRLEKYLNIYQSSSPSYLLMAGIDKCISLLEEHSTALFSLFYNRLDSFYNKSMRYENIRILTSSIVGKIDIYGMDPSKLTIYTEHKCSGMYIEKLLREKYHIIMEMCTNEYVLGITSICDTDEGFDRLSNALLEIDWEISKLAARSKDSYNSFYNLSKPVQILAPYETLEYKSEVISLTESQGRIANSNIGFYPPGIPLIIPGERIDKELINMLEEAINKGYMVTGLIGLDKDKLEVLCI